MSMPAPVLVVVVLAATRALDGVVKSARTGARSARARRSCGAARAIAWNRGLSDGVERVRP